MKQKMRFLVTLNKDKDDESYMDAAEISLRGTPDQLRYLAHFILRQADLIAERGEEYDHAHLQDEWRYWKYECDCDVITSTHRNGSKPSE